MTARRHATQRPWRGRRGLITGIPLALTAVGLLVALAVSLLSGGGTGPGSPAAAPVGAVRASTPPGSAAPVAEPDATRTSSRPSAVRTPSASAAASASASAAASANGTARAASAAAPLAGRIRPAVTYHGVATAYAAGDGGGSCLFGPSADLMVAAMNYTDYEAGKACGDYVLVRAGNGATLTVRIVNECPLPCAVGQLDLSQQAFAKLAKLSVGRLPITWTLLSPADIGTMSIRYKTGSTRWWCGIQVIGHRNPVAELEVRTAGAWRRLPRTDYNYFLSADGSGCGGAIRVTDIYGEKLTVNGIALRPDAVQPTRVQFARH
ncbi:expansin EXLX1 family cellulose-binding protein [Streptacidiphilus sp. N1-12]|uniref:Expansin EXLX1 family cellulose-binding protein n=2 Tax=Streptacidiphilus alkalitolerans TaxID=3342712 RepID=A0ABV6WSE7_9ACTN